ncbi:MAG: hypothetical protein Kow0042_15770 [Calditrichia bacterium]
MNWALNIPVQVINQKIKIDYATFLIKERLIRKTPSIPAILDEKPLVKENARIDPSIKIPRGSSVSEAVSRVSRQRSGIETGRRESRQDEYSRFLFPESEGIIEITAALEGVGGFSGLPETAQRYEKYLSFHDESRYLEQLKGPINIPRPETIQFASKNGTRDLQETTAIISLNEDDIHYCIERFIRYDPTFSGDILVSFTIHPEGYVIPSSIKFLKSNISDVRVLKCIKQSIQRWRNFPRIALEEGNLTVTRKYVF